MKKWSLVKAVCVLNCILIVLSCANALAREVTLQVPVQLSHFSRLDVRIGLTCVIQREGMFFHRDVRNFRLDPEGNLEFVENFVFSIDDDDASYSYACVLSAGSMPLDRALDIAPGTTPVVRVSGPIRIAR
jgi:hypothetical protein